MQGLLSLYIEAFLMQGLPYLYIEVFLMQGQPYLLRNKMDIVVPEPKVSHSSGTSESIFVFFPGSIKVEFSSSPSSSSSSASTPPPPLDDGPSVFASYRHVSAAQLDRQMTRLGDARAVVD